MKRKPKRRDTWLRYEAEKKAIAARGLSNAEYEKAVRRSHEKESSSHLSRLWRPGQMASEESNRRNQHGIYF